jgi:hypothetical protein
VGAFALIAAMFREHQHVMAGIEGKSLLPHTDPSDQRD